MLEDKELFFDKAGTIRIKQFPTSKALKFSVAIGKLLMPVAQTAMLQDQRPNSGKMQVSLDAVDIARTVVGAMDVDGTPELIREIIKASVVSPAWDDGAWYEVKFAANFRELFMLLQEIVKFNYGGVLDLLGKTDMLGGDTSPTSFRKKKNPATG